MRMERRKDAEDPSAIPPSGTDVQISKEDPCHRMVEASGLEPLTYDLQSRCSTN
jgi:hypothetical protein